MIRVFIAVLLFGFSQSGMAQETVERSAPLAEGGSLEVINVAGSVEIRGWRKKEVQVRAELGQEAEQLIFEMEEDSLLIKVEQKKKEKDRYYGGSGSKLVINAPRSANLKIKTVSADVDIDDIRGDQRVRTVSGDLRTRIEGREAELRTVSGDLTVTGNGKANEVNLYSVSGTIEASGMAGEIRAEAVSGDIEVKGQGIADARLKTVSGDIQASMMLLADASLHMESVSGDVDVALPRDFAADYELTSFSGDISDVLGRKAKRKSEYSPGSELMFRHGKSDARVRANTLSGDIEIENKL